MTSIHDLHDMAWMLHVELTHHDGGAKGWYSPSLRRISTRRGMAVWDYKSTLAHELAHAYYNDEHTPNGHFNQRQETRADRMAARLLINREHLENLLPWHGNDFISLAIDLEVTPHLLEVYLNMHPLNQKEEYA